MIIDSSRTYTHASLFSGIGGFDLAASWIGWNNAFHCEINPFCQKILKYHFPESESYEDITKTDFRKWEGKIDVLSGGFPCQPFSVAGQRRGAEDNRYLWPQMLRAIQETKPTWVVGENVAGILTMVQPGTQVEVERSTSLFGEGYTVQEHRQQFVVETICQDLEQEGYSVQPILIPACAVGAPHRRDRIWFVARRLQSDNYKARERDNCRQGRLRFSESMGLESEQFRICLQNNQSKKRWKEMEDYLNAQIDLLCGRKRGNRPHQQKQVRQQKVEFENNCTLGELSQSLKRDWCEKTKRAEQMVCPNLCEQQKDSFRLFQDKRGSDECKNQCGENIVAHRADTGIEGVQQGGTDGVHSAVTASDTERIGRNKMDYQVQPEQPNGNRIDGNGCERFVTDTDGLRNTPFQESERTERSRRRHFPQQSQRRDTPERANGLHGLHGYASDSESQQSERCEPEQPCNGSKKQGEFRGINRKIYTERTNIPDWRNFPTQSPVCSRNDGLSGRLDGISFPAWRKESVKAYGNAIVPQVAYEIFKAIENAKQ